MGLQEQNRAWQKDLRLKGSALINSRLAKQISPEEYATHRAIAKTDAEECKRRGSKLADEIWSRRNERKASFVATL